MVIGAGGIGAQVLQFLGATGVGNITIVDDELVSEKAIQLQSLYGGNDLGKLKTIVSRQHLQHLYPLTRFEILNLRITSENAVKFLGDFDTVVDATNHSKSSYVINDACIRLKKSWVYGQTCGFSAEITVFNFNNGPSYRCLYPEPEEGDKKDETPALVFGTTGCIMATECIKLLLESNELLSGRILNFDLYSNTFIHQTISRREENFNI